MEMHINPHKSIQIHINRFGSVRYLARFGRFRNNPMYENNPGVCSWAGTASQIIAGSDLADMELCMLGS